MPTPTGRDPRASRIEQLAACLALCALTLAPACLPTAGAADRSERKPGPTEAGYYLGVGLGNTRVTFPNTRPVPAVEITAVQPGSPAAAAGLTPGDVIVWVNGARATSYEQVQHAIARSGGLLRLSLVRAGTRAYLTLPPIRLVPLNTRTVVIAEHASGNPPPPTTGAEAPKSDHPPAKGDEPKKGEEKKAEPKKDDEPKKAESKKDGSPPTDLTPSREIPRFPWPPPLASARAVIPADLVHKAGKTESMLDVARRLEAAFDKAGYGEVSYYAVPKGFAMATRLEQFADDGTPLREPARWSASVAPPRVFSLTSYLQALFRANPGHFRVIVLVVTPEPIVENVAKEVTRDEAALWPSAGANKLPRAYARIPYDENDDCTALIYEFEQPAADDPPVLKNPGMRARVHLEKSNLLKGLAP